MSALPRAAIVVALVAAALGGAGCITRAELPDAISFPRAVAQLRALGVPAAYDDELLADLAALHCQRPAGATSAEVEPLLLRRIVGDQPVDVADVALVQTVGLLPAAACDPPHGVPQAELPSGGPDLWSSEVDSLTADRAALRANVPAAVGQVLGREPTVEYPVSGVLTLEFEIEAGRTQQQLAAEACRLVQGLAAFFAYINMPPTAVALIAGDHDPRLRLTVVSGTQQYVLDSSPGRLSDLLVRCLGG